MSPRSARGKRSHSSSSICSAWPLRASVITMRMVSTSLPVHAGSGPSPAVEVREIGTSPHPRVLSAAASGSGGSSGLTRSASKVNSRRVVLNPSKGRKLSKESWSPSAKKRFCFAASKRTKRRKGSPMSSSTNRNRNRSSGTTRPKSTSIHHSSSGSSGSGSQKVFGSPSAMLAAR